MPNPYWETERNLTGLRRRPVFWQVWVAVGVLDDRYHYNTRSDETRHVHAYLSVRKLCTYHVQVQKCLFHEIGVVRGPIPSQTREPGVYPALHWQMVGVSAELCVLHSNG